MNASKNPPINDAQILFFRSIVENAFQKENGSLRFSVESAQGDSIALSVYRAEDADAWEISLGSNPPAALPRSEALEQILGALTASGGALLIEQDDVIQRACFKNGKIVRETLDKRPSLLKNPLWAIGKTTHLDPNRAAPLLQAIGLMTAQGEIKAPMRRKFKQVNHFIELLQPHLPTGGGKKPYIIVDCGCGNSYLGFVLFWYVRQVMNLPARFFGFDIAQERIDSCRERAERLALPEMRFECAANREARFPENSDLLIALHACDTATDEALALGVVRKVKHIAAAPCCQHELASQIEAVPMYPILKHGLFKHRFADLLTDMMRCLFLEAHGYSVTVGEFISVEETPKNLLIRAKRGNPSASERMAEYEAFKYHYRIAPIIDAFVREMRSQA